MGADPGGGRGDHKGTRPRVNNGIARLHSVAVPAATLALLDPKRRATHMSASRCQGSSPEPERLKPVSPSAVSFEGSCVRWGAGGEEVGH